MVTGANPGQARRRRADQYPLSSELAEPARLRRLQHLKTCPGGLTNGLRGDLREQNTLVIGVHPAYIDTDRVANIQVPKSTPLEVLAITPQALSEDREEALIADMTHAVKTSRPT
ncbi:hypothetical protein [Pseudomonas sp. 1152_12]|uniref:hypothetical protein n=1 Tax=Pseudomonas sp. 1152_12 TaxID=2604455 RepID=UPI0040632F22